MDQTLADFVSEHGNSFHAKVVNKLRELKWERTVISPYYRDSATDKSREADIFASRLFGTKDMSVLLNLIIECKYFKNREVVFWSDSRDIDSTIAHLKNSFPPGRDYEWRSHHYVQLSDLPSPPVAKLFASHSLPHQPKGGTRDIENEPMFLAVDKVLNAVTYFRPDARLQEQSVSSVFYPVVIVDSFDSFYRVDVSNPTNSYSLKDQDFFQIEVNYAHKGQEGTEYFLIDGVAFSHIENYLQTISGWGPFHFSQVSFFTSSFSQ